MPMWKTPRHLRSLRRPSIRTSCRRYGEAGRGRGRLGRALARPNIQAKVLGLTKTLDPTYAAIIGPIQRPRCSAGFIAWLRLCAVLTREMWENAWGKFPTRRPALASYSSERRP